MWARSEANEVSEMSDASEVNEVSEVSEMNEVSEVNEARWADEKEMNERMNDIGVMWEVKAMIRAQIRWDGWSELG